MYITDFEIIRETINRKTGKTKAILLVDPEGHKFWIQARWVRKDGELTPAALKSLDTSIQAKADQEELIEVDAAWQSERAIGVDMTAEFTLDPTIGRTSARPKRIRVFLPKSWLKNGKIERRTFFNKCQEALDKACLPSGYSITGEWV